MYRIIGMYLLFFASASAAVMAENIEQRDLVGTWRTVWDPHSNKSIQLKVESNYSITLIVGSDMGNLDLTASAEDIEKTNGIFVVNFLDIENNTAYKLVFVGNKSGTDRWIHGTLFHYNRQEFVNSFPFVLSIP